MFKVGDNIGRYALLRRLAGGGMGEVFLAAQQGAAGVGPPVALKVLRQELASDGSFVQMMIDEAKISMFLNHQNIVSVLDFAEEDGAYYIAMEYVQGSTVEHLVDQLKHEKKRLDVSIGLFIGIEICRALKYAHACTNHLGEPLNIVHRDVTPANVLLSIQGEVKLTDFGIARARGRVHETQAGVVKGKFGYLAPEIARYEQIDARADLFALGVVLYQLLAGQHPVAGASVMEAIFRFEEKQLPPPSQFNPDISPAVEAIILRALEPRPEDRWSSAQELQVALQEAAMNDALSRRGLPNGAQALAALLKEVMPEVFEDPVPPEMPRDPTLPEGYANFSTKIFSASKEPAPRVPSAAMKKKPLPGIPQDASFVELIPAARSSASALGRGGGGGLGFGESTTHDMPKLPDPATDAGLLEAPMIDRSSADFEAQPTAFDEPTATGLDRFGAETSQDIPQLPDPDGFSTDSSEFGESTRIDHAQGKDPAPFSGEATIAGANFGEMTITDNNFQGLASSVNPRVDDPDLGAPSDTTVGVEPLENTLSMAPVDSSGFGDKTIADPSFRALVPPNDTLTDDEENAIVAPARIRTGDLDELGFEPTRIREGDSISPPGPKVTVPKITVPKITVPKAAPAKPAPKAVIPKITVPPVVVPVTATTVDPEREEQPTAAESGSSNDAFGGNTEKWIAGKIDGKALSWSDDDAARRAVETRNAFKNVANSSPAPSVVPKPSAVAVRATSHPRPQPQPQSQPQPFAPQPFAPPPPTLHQPPPVSPFAPHLDNDVQGMALREPPRSKKGPVVAAFVALAVGIGTLAGALIYPTLFAPELSIITTPPGATVSINGARAGATPLELEVDPHVEQHIEIALEGYQTVVRDVTAIERGQTYAINVTLEHLEPEIRIAPSGGRVLLNGMEIGSGGMVRLRGVDPNGPVEVRVEAPGFEPYRNQWSRGSQIPAIVDVELKRR